MWAKKQLAICPKNMEKKRIIAPFTCKSVGFYDRSEINWTAGFMPSKEFHWILKANSLTRKSPEKSNFYQGWTMKMLSGKVTMKTKKITSLLRPTLLFMYHNFWERPCVLFIDTVNSCIELSFVSGDILTSWIESKFVSVDTLTPGWVMFCFCRYFNSWIELSSVSVDTLTPGMN